MRGIDLVRVSLGLLAVTLALGCTGEDAVPDRSKKLYSQYDEELVIRDFFDDRKNGFFVDVGSYHWTEISTTYFLERHLGWSGIAIDAQPMFAEGYKKHRPRTKFFSYAVTDKSGDTLKLFLVFGASSLDPEWYKNFNGGKEQALTSINVPTITLNDLLEQNNVSEIDFLSMDIEGAEPAALAGFDIEKYAPQLVCIEASPTNREYLAAYFDKHGYLRVPEARDYANAYFKPRSPREKARAEH